MNVKMRRHVERQIARRFILDAILAGYAVNVNIDRFYEPDLLPEPSTKAKQVLDAMFSTDDEHLAVYKDGKRVGWVWFVYGNDGYDVISDYTCNLDDLGLMKGADAVSKKWGG